MFTLTPDTTEVLYGLLYQAVWDTLRAFGEDPRRLGGQLGMTAVLHTWGSTLVRHVHLHCLVPGGALSPEGVWKSSKSAYLFPVRALSRHFRGTLVSRLRACANTGKLYRISREGEIDTTLDRLMAQDWVVYSKPCLEAGDRVIDYLARCKRSNCGAIAPAQPSLISWDGRQTSLSNASGSVPQPPWRDAD